MRVWIIVLTLMFLPQVPAWADSPYLRSHADDLVQWRTWSDDAFREARDTGRPIFLSIGYLACHWCHVMQRESFQNPDVAAVINLHFIPILVDRETHPDIDALYQHAVANMGKPSGWPLTVFLTPDRAPFWGGTYFPEPARAGMPAFSDILSAVAETYRTDKDAIKRSAEQALHDLQAHARAQHGGLSVFDTEDAATHLVKALDPFSGGFGHGAKFPNVPALTLIWKNALATDNPAHKDAVVQTLHQMIQGALFDHVGGGFFRYTVDPSWQVPHYEKMLDTQAHMVLLLNDVWRETQDPLILDALQRTVFFVEQSMALPMGSFVSALDADSLDPAGELAEGAYYTWDDSQIRDALGKGASTFFQHFAISVPDHEPGDGAGAIVRLSPEPVSPDRRLLEHRSIRPAPQVDAKIIASWSADMARALLDFGGVHEDTDSVQMARDTYIFLRDRLIFGPNEPQRIYDEGRAHTPALLDDLAAMGQLALELFAFSGEDIFLHDARRLISLTQAYWDHQEGGYRFSQNVQNLPTAFKPRFDEPGPSANARMVELLAHYALISGDADITQRAREAQTAFGGLKRNPGNFRPAAALFTTPLMMDAAVQVVILSPDGLEHDLRTTVLSTALPARNLINMAPDRDLPKGHPARYKELVDGKNTAYVCRGTICSLPITTPEDLRSTLISMRGPTFRSLSN